MDLDGSDPPWDWHVHGGGERGMGSSSLKVFEDERRRLICRK